MKTAIVLVLSVTAALSAADDKISPVKQPQPESNQQEVKKLGSVTWNLEAHKLVWVVQKGTVVNGEFTPTSEQQYEISPDEAMMAAAGETRGLDEQEAVSLHRLLDILSVYCAESVAWWDHPSDDPETVPAKPAKPQNEKTRPEALPNQKPVKVAEPEPPQRVAPDEMVARVRV
ncbi:MAG TPA: hypothetical protein VGH38_18720 [Bryobacteraceae bacterium]|jgi:hypothetical protein